ncbi:hypothetical protein IJ750_02145 [bacterium]|nr:hypothetical protein [bacterium]
MNIDKKNALLLMAVTGNYLFSAANVLLGIKKYSPNMFDHIVIYTDKQAKECDKQAISKIFDVEFKIYDFQLDSQKDRLRLIYYSNMTYARFEAFTYLNEYKKVFWLDSDLLITGDISGLLNYGDKCGLSMSLDLYPYPKGHSIRAFFVNPVPDYDMSATAYATGIIIFSDKLPNPLELREYLYKQTNKYSSYLKYAEQGILHMMAQDYNIEIEEFPKTIYHEFVGDNYKDAKITHLLGTSKPWQQYEFGAFDEWYENHIEWINLGGSECEIFENLLCSVSYREVFHGKTRYQNIMQKVLFSCHNLSKLKRQFLKYRILSNFKFLPKHECYVKRKKLINTKISIVKNYLKSEEKYD